MLASVVITTFNRADALPVTLDALARQDVDTDAFEVLVVDDGSTDRTPEVLAAAEQPYALRTFRLEQNQGISAGRNTALREAHGTSLILLSDDLVVPENFISTHVRMQESYTGAWVVGSTRQLDDLVDSPFGRYLDRLERNFEEVRKTTPVAPGVWEMEWPTARNMSMPREDLERIGLFDERYRIACEDQDLAQRARPLGVRFLFTTDIECLHNDHHADLDRYCRLQFRGTRDTAFFVSENPQGHSESPIAVENAYASRSDPPRLLAKKLVKSVLATAPVRKTIRGAVTLGERIGLPDRALEPLYRLTIGIAIFRGWREGLAQLEAGTFPREPQGTAYPTPA